jgi:hypothetical protein
VTPLAVNLGDHSSLRVRSPFGTTVRATMLKTGKQVIIRINDQGRLSKAASSMYHDTQPKFLEWSGPDQPRSRLKLSAERLDRSRLDALYDGRSEWADAIRDAD